MAIDPGWYPDGSGRLRYWDGAGWTPHVQAAAPMAPSEPFGAPVQPAAPTRRPRLGLWIGLGIAGVVLLVVVPLVVLASFLLPLTADGDGAAPAQVDGATADGDEAQVLAVYDAYIAAWFAGDCVGEASAATEAYRGGTVEEYCAQAGEPYAAAEQPRWDYEVIDVTVTGDLAVLVADEFVSGADGSASTETWTYELVRTGSGWLVDAAY